MRAVFPIGSISEDDSEDDEELRVIEEPGNSLLFVHQSKWQRRLLARSVFS